MTTTEDPIAPPPLPPGLAPTAVEPVSEDLVFTASPRVLDKGVTFKLQGNRIAGGEPWYETFTSRVALPTASLDMVMSSVELDKRGEVTGIHQAAAIPLLEVVIHPDDLPRFRQLMNDPDRAIDLRTLWVCAMTVVGKLVERPTGGSGG